MPFRADVGRVEVVMYLGECNGCGLCCSAKVNGVQYVCENLETLHEIGTEGATRCRVHSTRKMGMPVKQIPVDGVGEIVMSHCLPTYPRNKDAIPPQCSYVWIAGVQPVWHEGYEPMIDESEVEL